MMKTRAHKLLTREIALVCVVAMLIPFTVAFAGAQSITLNSATVGGVELAQTSQEASVIASGSTINIAGTHSLAGGEVTFLVTPEGVNSPIKGIDQKMSGQNDGAFTNSIALPVAMEEGTYEVRVSGEDVENPVVRYFKIVEGLVKLVTLTSEADSIKTIGGTLPLSAEIINEVTGDAIVWSVVSGADVVSVDQNGTVTALKKGVAVVRAALSTNPAVCAQKTIVVDTTAAEPVTLTISISGAGSILSAGAYEGTISGGSTASYPMGSQFEFSAVADENIKFIHWVDMRSGRVVSTDANYSLALGTSMTLQAVFRHIENPPFVIFMEKNNKVRATDHVTNEVTVPSDPYYMGYEFLNWKDKKDNSVQEFEAEDKILANTYSEDTIFVANHEKSANTYTVTFEGVEGLTTDQYQYDTKISVTPVEPEAGKKFAYWEKNGQIVSYDRNYSFFVGASDITIRAVFEDEDSSVAPAPTVVMLDPVVVPDNKIAFFAERNVLEQYTMLENGIILSTDTTNELTIENAMVRGISASNSGNGQYTIRKANVGLGETWAGRAYVIYKDGANIITIYSNTVTKTLE